MLIDNARMNHLTGTILGSAIEVHRVIGPGLLESPYMPCFEYELTERGLSFVAQAPIALTYKTLQLDAVYKVDLLVEDMVIVEVKCVEALAGAQGAVAHLHATDEEACRTSHQFQRSEAYGWRETRAEHLRTTTEFNGEDGSTRRRGDTVKHGDLRVRPPRAAGR